jgi:hypothetical protein
MLVSDAGLCCYYGQIITTSVFTRIADTSLSISTVCCEQSLTVLLISVLLLHEQEALRRQLERYLQAAGSEEEHFALPQLDSVRAMKEVCRLFKGMLLDAREEARRAIALADGAVGDGNGTSATNTTDSNSTALRSGALSRGDARGSDKSLLSSTDAVYVGKPESRGGFSLGRAPDNAFPAVMPMTATSNVMNSGNTSSGSRSGGQRRSGGGSDNTATTAAANSGANGNASGNTTAVLQQNKSAIAAMVLSPPQSPEPRRYEDPLLQSLQSDGEGDAVEHNSNSSSNNWRNANGTTATKQQQQQQFTLGGVSTEARSRLFAQFKSSTTEGCTVCDSIQEARAAARELRTLARSKAGEVNAAKRTIDDLQSALDSKRAAGSGSSANTALLATAAATGECIMDEEEFKLVKLERDAKRTYKAAYDELRSLRQSAEAAQSQVDSLKLELLSLFEEWAAGRVTVESSTNGAAAVLDSSDYRSPAWEGAAVARTASNTSSTDKLDENELFESMEVERQDPEAVAFFQAQKNAQATRSQNTLALRQMHRSKRYK